MATPAVSVLMPVYNGSRYLHEAIDSILNQTFSDFEFIIINDGSVDDTSITLASYSDPRIVHLRNETNLGIVSALNFGLSVARGEYIARLDADDIAHSTRLGRQVDYLRKHLSVVLLGSGYMQLDLIRNRTLKVIPPLSDGAIRKAMVSGNPICHSSVMIRHDALVQAGTYDDRYRYSEDYELWSRLAQYGQLANIPENLITRRYHENSITNDMSNELIRLRVFWQSSMLAINRLGFPRLYRLLTLRSICLFLVVDLYTASIQWWRKHFILHDGENRP